MKKFFVCVGRRIVRFSEKSDQKDAVTMTEEQFYKELLKRFYLENQAKRFIQSVKDNSEIGFNDWLRW